MLTSTKLIPDSMNKLLDLSKRIRKLDLESNFRQHSLFANQIYLLEASAEAVYLINEKKIDGEGAWFPPLIQANNTIFNCNESHH